MNDFGDRGRTERRYKEAVKELERCFEFTSSSFGDTDFLHLDEFKFGENDQISYLRDKIDEMLEARNSVAQNRNVVRGVFTAMAPLSKTLLTVLTQSQPVPSRQYESHYRCLHLMD